MNYQKTEETIVKWLKDYLENAGQQGFVLGISGGVDSAVVSTLCAKTNYPVLCLEMPINQHSDHVSRSTNHIAWLKENFNNVSTDKIDLSDSFNGFLSDIPQYLVFKNDRKTAEANTRSRLRMTTLYYFSNCLKFLVVGTGNKVEDFGVGYFTRGGDGVCDLSPIGDLTKTEVWELAKHLGINEEIINASPSDGLYAEELTDEDALGATYPELEWAMDFVENNCSEENLTDRESEVLTIYETLHNKNKFKMSLPPICKIEK